VPAKVAALHIWRKDNLLLTSTLRTGRSTFRLPERKKRFFTFTKSHGQLWSLTSLHSFLGVKRAKRKVYNSPPSVAEVENEFPYKAWTGTALPCRPFQPQMKFSHVEILNLTHPSESASHNTVYSCRMPFQVFFHKTCSRYKYYRTEENRDAHYVTRF
jgi:hypothetical protein